MYQEGEFLALDDQTKAVVCCGLPRLQVNKTLLYITSSSINRPRCDFLKNQNPSHHSRYQVF
jgi:hypothetical protein